MSNWRDKFKFFDGKHVTHEVNGESVNFYPISTGLAFRLKDSLKSLSGAIAAVFSDTRNDVATVSKQVPLDDGTTATEIQAEAISPELASLRHSQKSEGVMALVDSLMDDRNQDLIGEIIMDSLADQFPRDEQKDRPPGREFLNGVPLPCITEMLWGVMSANKGVLGPLASKWETFGAKAREAMADRLNLTSGSLSENKSSGSEGEAGPPSGS